MEAKSEELSTYAIERVQSEDAVIARALEILAQRVSAGPVLTSPGAVKDFLVMRAAAAKDQYVEIFAVVFLDSQNRVVATESMFTGTLTQTSVYPRELVRAALRHNAAAVILTHNHPSGSVEPSRADEALTQTLKTSLALVDVRVLDHIITAPDGRALSMAERGLL